jgi:hypothetical protein
VVQELIDDEHLKWDQNEEDLVKSFDRDLEMGRMVMEAFGRCDELQGTNGVGLARIKHQTHKHGILDEGKDDAVPNNELPTWGDELELDTKNTMFNMFKQACTPTL